MRDILHVGGDWRIVWNRPNKPSSGMKNPVKIPYQTRMVTSKAQAAVFNSTGEKGPQQHKITLNKLLRSFKLKTLKISTSLYIANLPFYCILLSDAHLAGKHASNSESAFDVP